MEQQVFCATYRGKKMTTWLILRMAGLRLDTTLIGITTSWFQCWKTDPCSLQ